MLVEVTDKSFKEEVLESNVPVLVDFWASWCRPCRLVKTVIEEIAEEYEGKLKVCQANIIDAQDTAIAYEVMNIPSLLIFKNGQMVERIVGVIAKEMLQSKINSILA